MLAEAKERPEILLQVGLEYRYMPPVAKLLEYVKAGALGRVRMVAIREHRFPFLVKVSLNVAHTRPTLFSISWQLTFFLQLLKKIPISCNSGQELSTPKRPRENFKMPRACTYSLYVCLQTLGLLQVDNWNRFNKNTGGTLVEKCCHFFDLMNLITGATPVRILASGAQSVNHLDENYGGEVKI